MDAGTDTRCMSHATTGRSIRDAECGRPVPIPERADERETTRTIEIRCASGDRTTATWNGVPIETVMDEEELPLDTTHLLVESRDGYRSCLPIREAIAGLLAFVRENPDGDTRPVRRLVAPGVDGARCVKDVDSMRPLRLEAGEDPSEYERTPQTA